MSHPTHVFAYVSPHTSASGVCASPPLSGLEERLVDLEDKLANSDTAKLEERLADLEDKLANANTAILEERLADLEHKLADANTTILEERLTDLEYKLAAALSGCSAPQCADIKTAYRSAGCCPKR